MKTERNRAVFEFPVAEMTVRVAVQDRAWRDGDRALHCRLYVAWEDDSIPLPGLAREQHATEVKTQYPIATVVVDYLAMKAARGNAPDWMRREDESYSAKINYSRKAGCSCGCSPGFIVKGVLERLDVFVTVTNTRRAPRESGCGQRAR